MVDSSENKGIQEELWKILLKNIEWIKFSEAKAIFILTIYGVILTVIYANSKDVYTAITESCFTIFFSIAAGTAASFSAWFSFSALDPVLHNKNPTSVIYFGHVQKAFKNHLEYQKQFLNIFGSEADYSEQIGEQVFSTSKIAWRKFRYVSFSIRLFLIIIAFIFLNLISYLFTA